MELTPEMEEEPDANSPYDRMIHDEKMNIINRLTQDILRHGDDMIVGVRTNGLWIFRHQPENPEHYFKGCLLYTSLTQPVSF